MDFILNGEFLIGSYIVEVCIIDGCGNWNKGDLVFEIVDCKVFMLICINGLVVELLLVVLGIDVDNDGVVDFVVVIIYVFDFIVSEGLDCFGFIIYFINRVGEDVDLN